MIARNQLIGLIAGVVLMVAAITGAVLVGSDTTHASPEAVVRSYLTAVYEQGNAAQYLRLFSPQDLQRLEAEYGIGMDVVRDELQNSLDDFHGRLASEEVVVTWEVESTAGQNGAARTIAMVTYTHIELGDTKDQEMINTIERDGRWYLEAEALEAYVTWLLQSRAAVGAP